jgi:hypothetical protein
LQEAAEIAEKGVFQEATERTEPIHPSTTFYDSNSIRPPPAPFALFPPVEIRFFPDFLSVNCGSGKI